MTFDGLLPKVGHTDNRNLDPAMSKTRILKMSRKRPSSPHNVANILQYEKTMPSKSHGEGYKHIKMIDKYVAQKYFEVNIEYIVR